jgi:hypothetical protein
MRFTFYEGDMKALPFIIFQILAQILSASLWHLRNVRKGPLAFHQLIISGQIYFKAKKKEKEKKKTF